MGGFPRVFAHRGFHAPLPGGPFENSLNAFKRGIAAGVDALELDVRHTRDGAFVIHHDPKVSGGRKIADLLASELPNLPDGQRIPRLSEVAELARSANMRLVVEMKEKGDEAGIVGELLAKLPASQFDIISFNPSSLKAVKKMNPSIRTGMLAPRIPGSIRESFIYRPALKVLELLHWEPALNRTRRVGADYAAVDWRMVSPNFLKGAAQRGIGLDVWTVDDAKVAAKLLEIDASDPGRIHAITTDLPDMVMKLRQGRKPLANSA